VTGESTPTKAYMPDPQDVELFQKEVVEILAFGEYARRYTPRPLSQNSSYSKQKEWEDDARRALKGDSHMYYAVKEVSSRIFQAAHRRGLI
jgi:hypothetical protein